MKKEEKICIDCGKIGVKERRRCEECAKKYNSERMKKRYKETGYRTSYGEEVCPVCGKTFIKWKKDQISHGSCKTLFNQGDYHRFINPKTGNTFGLDFVKELGIELPKGYVIHHLDENPMNNIKENLVMCSRSSHQKLHRLLQRNRLLLLKEIGDNNFEEHWLILRIHLTNEWMISNVKDIIMIQTINVGE